MLAELYPSQYSGTPTVRFGEFLFGKTFTVSEIRGSRVGDSILTQEGGTLN